MFANISALSFPSLPECPLTLVSCHDIFLVFKISTMVVVSNWLGPLFFVVFLLFGMCCFIFCIAFIAH